MDKVNLKKDYIFMPIPTINNKINLEEIEKNLLKTIKPDEVQDQTNDFLDEIKRLNKELDISIEKKDEYDYNDLFNFEEWNNRQN